MARIAVITDTGLVVQVADTADYGDLDGSAEWDRLTGHLRATLDHVLRMWAGPYAGVNCPHLGEAAGPCQQCDDPAYIAWCEEGPPTD